MGIPYHTSKIPNNRGGEVIPFQHVTVTAEHIFSLTNADTHASVTGPQNSGIMIFRLETGSNSTAMVMVPTVS